MHPFKDIPNIHYRNYLGIFAQYILTEVFHFIFHIFVNFFYLTDLHSLEISIMIHFKDTKSFENHLNPVMLVFIG